MDQRNTLADLTSSVIMGGVLGVIFYFIIESVGLPEVGQIELGMVELILIGVVGGVLLHLVGRVAG